MAGISPQGAAEHHADDETGEERAPEDLQQRRIHQGHAAQDHEPEAGLEPGDGFFGRTAVQCPCQVGRGKHAKSFLMAISKVIKQAVLVKVNN